MVLMIDNGELNDWC